MFIDYGNPGARRQFPHGCWKIDVLIFHYESESAATGATAKTMKRLSTRAHHKRRRFLLMKRAKRLEIRAGAFQRKICADDFDDVVRGRDLLNCF